MLFNPNWKTETKEEKFEGVSRSGIIAWLEQQNPDQIYDYADPMSCAAAQYKRAMGYSGNDVIVCFGVCPMPGDAGFWLCEILGHSPYTFGAALSRARRLKRLDNRDDGAAE
jgi:hypothetical protein